MSGAALEISDLSLAFSGVQALKDVALSVPAGSLCAVIGPNGAGKTSLFNCISGVYRPQRGAIQVAGRDVVGMAPHRVAGLGVARMFQNLALFEHLTVLENLLLGRHHLYTSGWFGDAFGGRKSRREELRHRAACEHVIDFLDLQRYRKQHVAIVPYGIRKRIELGRALCAEPQILLLDEPAAGLNQEETEDMARYILDVAAERGITQVLIEHDLRFVLDLADQVCVLDFGHQIAVGPPDEMRQHPRVVAAYMGTEGAA